MSDASILIGTAGWSIPKPVAARFPATGTHLQRYSRVLPCTEINSSFRRPHSRKTYEKWADQTPAAFRFSVKVPRTITHELRLRGTNTAVEVFLEQVGGLGPKLGAILVQLPPSLRFEAHVAEEFFASLRNAYAGAVAFEPRHSSWFDESVAFLLGVHRVSRVIADPPIANTEPYRAPRSLNGDVVEYWRLHGSPKMYWSRYSSEMIQHLAEQLGAAHRTASAWCIFDNTAAGAAIENALELAEK